MISYRTTHQNVADALHGRLVAERYAPRLDHLDLLDGQRWHDEIAWWLAACQVAVVLLSHDALDSPWVRHELSILTNRHLVDCSLGLVLVYLDGYTPAEARSHPDAVALQLDQIQATLHIDTTAGELPAGAIDEIVATVASVSRTVEDDRLVELVRREVPAAEVDVGVLDDGLRAWGITDDPWVTVAAQSGSGSADHVARLAFARHFCDRGFDAASRVVLHNLVPGGTSPKRAAKLLELNVVTSEDPVAHRSLATVAAERAPARPAIALGRRSTDLAHVLVDMLNDRFETGRAKICQLVDPPTGGAPDVTSQALLGQIDAWAAGEDANGDAKDFLRRQRDLGFGVFVLLTPARWRGLTPAMIDALRGDQTYQAVTLVLLAHEAEGVGAWRSLGGHRRVVGLDEAGPHWERWVDYERLLAGKLRDARAEVAA